MKQNSMESFLETILGNRPDRQRQLYSEWRETGWALERAYCQLDSLTDPDLVEAWIFEIQALSARHTHLLRRIKKQREGVE